MGSLFSDLFKMLGIGLMMAVITTPGLRWTTSQAFKDKYHDRGLVLLKQIEKKVDELPKHLGRG